MELEKLFTEVSEITLSTYDSTEDLQRALEELLNEYKNLSEAFRDYAKNVDDNYKQITKEEQIYG